MSEELTTSTTQRQDSTQSGSISLPDLNLSIPVHIHLTADPALQAALERIADVLKLGRWPVVYRGLCDPKPDEIEPLSEEDEAKLKEIWKIINEANRKSEQIKIEKRAKLEAEKNEKMGGKSEKSPSNPEKSQQNLKKPRKHVHWTDIPKHSHLRYRTEGGKLILNYSGSIVETTWQQMEKASKVDQKYQKQEIEKILGARRANNRKAAISLFLKLIESGDIKVPTPNEEFEENFKQFQYEEEVSV